MQQTNGGLLIAVNSTKIEEVKERFTQNGLQNFIEPIGRFIRKEEKVILVRQ